MGQTWCLISIDREEKRILGKMGEWFNDGLTNAHTEALIRPPRALPRIPRIPSNGDVLNTWASGRTAGSGLITKLPLELLYHIVADVAEPITDLAKFASASHLFWDTSRPHIERHSKAKAWAGSRIICFGDSVDDFPPGVLSDADKASMEKRYADAVSDDEYPPPFFRGATDIFTRPDSLESTLLHLTWHGGLPRAVQAALNCMLPISYKSAGKPAVLRNLSKKAFVRSQAVDALSRAIMPEFMAEEEGYCLGDALMSHICWSSNTCCSMRGPESLTFGPWAGDRFDVILAEEFEMQSDHAEWKDASEEVCDKLSQCWEGR